MKMTPPPPLALIASGEAQPNGLSAFVGEALKAIPSHTSGTIELIARSAASPIARAILDNGAEIARRRWTVSAIFAELGAERTTDGWMAAGPRLPFETVVRHLSNRTYHDIHEQIVIGSAHTWYGDSLRRDPEKRDALSLLSRDCKKTVVSARRTFAAMSALAPLLTLEVGSPAVGTVNLDLSGHGIPDVTPPMGALQGQDNVEDDMPRGPRSGTHRQ